MLDEKQEKEENDRKEQQKKLIFKLKKLTRLILI